jgi:hypothetical protein
MSSPKVASAAGPTKADDKPAAGTLSPHATQLAVDLEHALAQGDLSAISPDALQVLTAALCKTYSAQVEAGNGYLPLANRTAISSTDVMTMASGLLRGSNLAVFELGMWQSWTGR